ncbi:MAG: DUF6702 family protein [Bacteroidota bacterium]
MFFLPPFLLFFLHWSITVEARHGIYLSVIEISQSEDTRQTKLKLKTFPDDLENVLRLFEKELYQPGDIRNKAERILAYFSKNLLIKLNNKPIRLKWAGCQMIGESLEISFWFSEKEKWQKMDIKAIFFTELFLTQQNIIQIKKPGVATRFLKFKAGDSWQTISFPVK